MNYLNNIKNLIENDTVLRRKHRLQEENHRLKTYFEIGELIVEAQGGEKRARRDTTIRFIFNCYT